MANIHAEIESSQYGDYRILWENDLNNPNIVFDFINKNFSFWKSQKSPAIWISLKGNDLKYLKDFLAFGFEMHHIVNKDILILQKQIISKSSSRSAAPSTYIGVTIICFNHEGKLLCVRENYKSGPGKWKFPTGLFDTEKDSKISDAAIREVYEEAGIHSHFKRIYSQQCIPNSFLFHLPVWSFKCEVIPDDEVIHFDPVEIADCQWLDIDYFKANCDSYSLSSLNTLNNTGNNGFSEQEYPNEDMVIYSS